MPITVTHAKSNTIADFTGTVTVGNSSGGTQTVAATNLVRPSDWNSAHALTLSVAASEIASLFYFNGGLSSSTNTAGISAGIEADAYYEPFVLPNTNSTLSAPGIGTWYLDPIQMHGPWRNGIIFMPVGGGLSTNFLMDGAVWSATLTGSNTRYQTHWNALALYRAGTGTASTRLESLWSTLNSILMTWERRATSGATNAGTISQYLTISMPNQIDSTGGQTFTTVTGSGTTGYAASTAASTIASGLLTGPARYFTGSRMEMIPIGDTTIPPGDYWLGHMFSSSTSVTGTNYTGGTVFTTQSRLGLLENNQLAFKRIGSSTTNSTSSPQLFHGFLATTTLSASSVIASSDVRQTTGRAYFNFAQTTF